MTDLVWLHEDALTTDHPLFEAAAADCRIVFIWDEGYLEQMDYGFKRLLFIYETLLELPCEILKGDFETCLGECLQQGSGRLLVPATPNPALREVIDRLGQSFPIEVVDAQPFVPISGEPDLRRFFRYWNKARKLAMQPGGGVPSD